MGYAGAGCGAAARLWGGRSPACGSDHRLGGGLGGGRALQCGGYLDDCPRPSERCVRRGRGWNAGLERSTPGHVVTWRIEMDRRYWQTLGRLGCDVRLFLISVVLIAFSFVGVFG